MPTVFISYAHADEGFVKRLVADLEVSSIRPLFDKTVLQVGDSIIDTLADTVSASDYVVVVLSKHSVQSQWVRKELSLALTQGIKERRGKVLPAVIDAAERPASLGDTLYADFRMSYFEGIRHLMHAMAPEQYTIYGIGDEGRTAGATPEAVESAILSNPCQPAIAFFLKYPRLISGLFNGGWSVNEAVPGIAIGNNVADFLVVNGQSGRYDLVLVSILPYAPAEPRRAIIDEVSRVSTVISTFHDNADEVRRLLALKMHSGYGAEQIAPDAVIRRMNARRGATSKLILNAKILCGAREAYNGDLATLRVDIHAQTDNTFELVSYGRLFDSMREPSLFGRS